MRKMIKLAIGLAALGFVELIGLSTMSMLWAIAAPHPFLYPVAGEEVPARTAEVQDIEHVAYRTFNASAEPARVGNVDIAYPMTGYAVVNANSHFLGIPRVFIAMFFAVVALIVLVGAFVILLRLTRAKRAALPEDIELVHELSRRAQDLSQRMEALETILLDRARATR